MCIYHSYIYICIHIIYVYTYMIYTYILDDKERTYPP